MSKAAARRRQRRRDHVPKTKPPKPVSDKVVYLILLLVGFFIIVLTFLWADGSPEVWRSVAFGYLLAIAYLINFYTFQVYRGKHLGNWQQSLARVPLRFVGYGTKGGKPLEAAHDHPETKTALFASVAVSLVVVLALFLVLIPGVLGR